MLVGVPRLMSMSEIIEESLIIPNNKLIMCVFRSYRYTCRNNYQ